MKRSDWITVCSMIAGVLVTTIASVAHLSYKIGSIDEKVSSMEKLVEHIPRMEVEIAEIKVKVDALWQRDIARAKQTKGTDSLKIKHPPDKYSL